MNGLRLRGLRPDPGQLGDAMRDAHRLGLGKRTGAEASSTGGATRLIIRQQHILTPGPHTLGGLWPEPRAPGESGHQLARPSHLPLPMGPCTDSNIDTDTGGTQYAACLYGDCWGLLQAGPDTTRKGQGAHAGQS